MDLTGANPSAEEAEEALADGATQINNIVNSFRLQATQFDKKASMLGPGVFHPWLPLLPLLVILAAFLVGPSRG